MDNITLLGKTTIQKMISIEDSDFKQPLKNFWYYSEFSFEDISAVSTQAVYAYYHFNREENDNPHIIIMTTVKGDILGIEGSSMGFHSNAYNKLIEAFITFMTANK